MNSGKTIFAQLMDFVPKYEFHKCVNRYRGNYKVKSFSCWDQFLCMAFAQLTYRESLRDIEACLRSMQSRLYHLGIRGKISRNTLAHANAVRNWHIYADFAQLLIQKARRLYRNENFGLELEQTVYVLDATVIDLCLSLFPWAKFRKHKAAIKLHTLMDLRGNIPTVVIITPAKVHELNILDELIFEPGAIYVLDRGFIDFSRLYRIHQSSAFFITRTKRNFKSKRLYSHPIDKSTSLRSDHTVLLQGFYARKHYSEKLRRIRLFDAENKVYLTFLTNNFTLPALTIAQLYQYRWQVELFFRWIKQHLRIKAFFGTSDNAVKTQIWIAISVYLLVAIVKKQLKLQQSLYTILQIFSITLFEKMPILKAFADLNLKEPQTALCEQLNLFN